MRDPVSEPDKPWCMGDLGDEGLEGIVCVRGMVSVRSPAWLG